MPDKTYKLIEIVGVSEESIQQAVRNGLVKASRTLRNLDWFEVTAIRGAVLDNRRPVFQVQMKVGFRLLDRDLLEGSDLGKAPSGGRGARAARGAAKRKAR